MTKPPELALLRLAAQRIAGQGFETAGGAVRWMTATQAQDYPALCEGTAIVTGTREDTRAEGLARALRDVLVKRSGDPGLLRDRRVDPGAVTFSAPC